MLVCGPLAGGAQANGVSGCGVLFMVCSAAACPCLGAGGRCPALGRVGLAQKQFALCRASRMHSTIAEPLPCWLSPPTCHPSFPALQTLERGGSLEDGSSSALGMLLNRSGAALAAPFVGVLAAALSLVGLLEEGASAGPSAPAGAAGAAGTGATPAAATTAAVHAEDDMSIVDMRRSRQARQEAWAEQQAAAASAPPPPPPAPRAPSPNGGSASMGASPNGSSSSSNGTSAAVLEEVAQPVLAAAAAANGAAGSRPAGGGGSGRPAARRRAAAPAASLAPVDAASAMLAEFASQVGGWVGG